MIREFWKSSHATPPASSARPAVLSQSASVRRRGQYSKRTTKRPACGIGTPQNAWFTRTYGDGAPFTVTRKFSASNVSVRTATPRAGASMVKVVVLLVRR